MPRTGSLTLAGSGGVAWPSPCRCPLPGLVAGEVSTEEECMRRFLLPALLLAIAGAVAALAGFGSGRATSEAAGHAARRADADPAAPGVGLRTRGAWSSAPGWRRTPAPSSRRQSLQRSLLTGCPVNRGSNVRVNQNCLNLTDPDLQGRGQAQNETAIAQDSGDPRRMVVVGERLPPRRRQLLLVLLRRRRSQLAGLDAADGLHPRDGLRWRRAPVLAGRRRHVGRVGHQGQRLPVVPDVHARRRGLQQPGRVERVLRLPLDRQRRRLLELPGPARSPSSTTSPAPATRCSTSST